MGRIEGEKEDWIEGGELEWGGLREGGLEWGGLRDGGLEWG